MKKIICLVLCFCMIGGLALSINGETNVNLTNDTTLTIQESVDIISKNLITGEETNSVIAYTPEAKLLADGTIGNVHYSRFPEIENTTTEMGDEILPDAIIGEDGRSKVSNTRNIPNSAICYIECWFGNSRYTGTA